VTSLIDEFKSPMLKLAYDTYHFPLGAQSRQTLKHIAPFLGIVYLGDRRTPPTIDHERCPLGQGRLPLAETVMTLIGAGYVGPFDVKLIGPEIHVGDYWLLLEQSRLAFAEFSQAAVPRSLA
jgi:sugar phosphate isomerase/epimerase